MYGDGAVRRRCQCAGVNSDGAVREDVRRCGALRAGEKEEEEGKRGMNTEGETVAPLYYL